jgi:hypothetical protein
MALVGKQYEKRVLHVLSRVRFELVHLGGANDGGVDLRGVWALPNSVPRVPVIAQCKVRSLNPTGREENIFAQHSPSFAPIFHLCNERRELVYDTLRCSTFSCPQVSRRLRRSRLCFYDTCSLSTFQFVNAACKPSVLRELEGTLLRESTGTLGLVVCSAG